MLICHSSITTYGTIIIFICSRSPKHITIDSNLPVGNLDGLPLGPHEPVGGPDGRLGAGHHAALEEAPLLVLDDRDVPLGALDGVQQHVVRHDEPRGGRRPRVQVQLLQWSPSVEK